MGLIPLQINGNKCPCGCEKMFTERKTVYRNAEGGALRRLSCFYIDSWNYANQKWGHAPRGRWHLVMREFAKKETAS